MNIDTLSAIADKKIQLCNDTLKDFRTTELNLFKENGFKETVLDSYKFTNLETFFSSLSYEPNDREIDSEELKATFSTITLLDGELSEKPNLPSGISIKSIKDHFNEVKKYIQSTNALSHLHHSLFHEGFLIEIDKKVEINEPIRILNIITKPSVLAPTHLVLAQPFSKVTIIEETRGLNISHVNVSESYLVAQTGSHIEHIKMELESDKGLNHGSVFASVEQDATVKSFIFHATGKLNRNNLVLNLNAPGANGESYCLYLTNGTEHSDINTIINHKAPDTTSSQMAKGILDGDSKGIFTGKIHIFPKSQRVASSQLNKNLLLSKKAQVHSQPQLEIFADDVKCSHGSTTGQLSDDEVFYFQARGIPADKAKTILALGFGLEVAQKIANKAAREHISTLIMDNLNKKFQLAGQL